MNRFKQSKIVTVDNKLAVSKVSFSPLKIADPQELFYRQLLDLLNEAGKSQYKRPAKTNGRTQSISYGTLFFDSDLQVITHSIDRHAEKEKG
jgi:hypothetical protein